MRGEYLCGCSIEGKRDYISFTDHKGNPTTEKKDRQGYRVCPEHEEREYGWKTGPMIQTKNGMKVDYGAGPKIALEPDTTKLVDRRDNRDPQTVYENLLASRAHTDNGKVSV